MANAGSGFPLDSKYASGAEQARQDAAVEFSVAMTLLGSKLHLSTIHKKEDRWYIATFVGLRVYTRSFIVRNMGMEDWTMVAAAIFTLVFVTQVIVGAEGYKVGFSAMSMNPDQMVESTKTTIIVIVPTECTSLRKAWDFAVPGHCIDTALFYYIISSISRPLREKLAVYAVFGLGLFGTICALIRSNYLVVVSISKEPFHDSLPTNTWSVIEINVGIVCATLPNLHPLYSKAQRNRTKQELNVSDEKDLERMNSKRSGLVQAKEMFITITAGTSKDFKTCSAVLVSLQENFDRLPDLPPPIPPKDVKLPKTAIPKTTYQKL